MSKIAITVLLLIVACPEPATALSYEVVKLTTGSSYSDSTADSINDVGIVVGGCRYNGSKTAFLWSSGNLTTLPNSNEAVSINKQEIAVGFGIIHATLWSNGLSRDLGTLGGQQSWAHSINDSNVVVGSSQASSTSFEYPFIWENGMMSDLNIGKGRAYSINNEKQIVGFIDAGAFSYQNGSLEILSGPNSSAFANNNLGHASGWAPYSNTHHATLWKNGVAIDLNQESAGSVANGMNDFDQVVGQAWTSSSYAFLWQNGQMLNLNDLIPQDSGWDLMWANDINNKGQIVGYGNRGAFLLNPVPEPSSIIALAVGLTSIGILKRRRRG